MARGRRLMWGYAGVSVVVIGGLIFTTPAYSAAPGGRTPSGVTPAAVTPSPTATPEPTPDTDPHRHPDPTPTPTPPPSDHLLPDVIALPAGDLGIQVRSDGRRLRFASSLGNIGAGPLEVRPNQKQPCPAGQHNSTQIIYRDANGNAKFNARARHPARAAPGRLHDLPPAPQPLALQGVGPLHAAQGRPRPSASSCPPAAR